jgi:hypothetical protein
MMHFNPLQKIKMVTPILGRWQHLCGNHYLIGSKDFIITEVAMFSLCRFMFGYFFREIYFEAKMRKKNYF